MSIRTTTLLAALLCAHLPLVAQTFPDKPVRLTVGFPPGTGPDVVARAIGGKLGELLKQNVIIDNKAGAGGQIAAQSVAKSPPDGYTLLLGEVGSISIAPAAYPKLPYDALKELMPVSEVVRADFVLVVPATSAARDVKAFADAGKARTDRTNFATFGAGTPGHFGAEVFAAAAGFKIEPVHYRATGDAVTALIAGDVQAAFVTTALAAPQVKAGKMRALATTAQQRSAVLPDVPTFAESGWSGVDFSAWFAVLVPAGTPAAVADTLNRHTVAAVQSPEVRSALQAAGFTVLGTSRADTEQLMRAEAQRWSAVVKSTGFKGD